MSDNTRDVTIRPILKYLAAGFMVALTFAAYVWFHPEPLFPLDDPYITLHNARVLAGAPEVNYAGVPALEGSTSTVHTVLVASLVRVLPGAWPLMAVSWIGILSYATAVMYLCSVHRAQPWVAAVLLPVSLLAGEVTLQLLNGLETGLAMAALVAALALASQERPSRVLCILCGILPFIRPELIVVSLLLLAKQEALRWESESKLNGVLLDLACAGAAGLVCLSPLLINTGHWYPETIQAKRLFFAESPGPDAFKFNVVFGALLKFIGTAGLPLIACAVFAVLSRTGRFALYFAAIFLLSYFVEFPGALWHNEQRYLYVLLPVAILGVAIGTSAENRIVSRTACAMVILAGCQTLLSFPSHWKTYTTELHDSGTEYASLAAFCNQNIPAGSRIMIHDAGYLSDATSFTLIDLVGLKTPEAVDEHARLTYPTGGRLRAQAIDEIAQKTHPDYLIVIADWERIFRIAAGLRAHGWSLQPVRQATYLNQYTVYRMSRIPLSP